jgi:hypothetical protein
MSSTCVVESESSVASNKEHINDVNRAQLMERIKTMSNGASTKKREKYGQVS